MTLRLTALTAFALALVLPVAELLVPYHDPACPLTFGWVGLACGVVALVAGMRLLRTAGPAMSGWQHDLWVMIMVFAVLLVLFDGLVVWNDYAVLADTSGCAC